MEPLIQIHKIYAICPICAKEILATDLKIDRIDLDKIEVFPFPITFCHSCDNSKNDLHAVNIYLDANLSVRGIEPSQYVIFDK
ncbi:MAG: hypothetical protein GY870_16175 [archaeon]|nr:hypothetical protein [archaeon]